MGREGRGRVVSSDICARRRGLGKGVFVDGWWVHTLTWGLLGAVPMDPRKGQAFGRWRQTAWKPH